MSVLALEVTIRYLHRQRLRGSVVDLFRVAAFSLPDSGIYASSPCILPPECHLLDSNRRGDVGPAILPLFPKVPPWVAGHPLFCSCSPSGWNAAVRYDWRRGFESRQEHGTPQSLFSRGWRPSCSGCSFWPFLAVGNGHHAPVAHLERGSRFRCGPRAGSNPVRRTKVRSWGFIIQRDNDAAVYLTGSGLPLLGGRVYSYSQRIPSPV